MSLKASEVATARAVLRRLVADTPDTETLRATYYDTPGRKLFLNGYTLRVRQEGRHMVQTLKHADPGGSDALHRDEWVDRIDGTKPDLGTGESGRRVRKRFGRPALLPQFAVEVRRERHRHVTADGTEIEIALDIGRVIAGRHNTPIREIELELKAGPVSAIYQFALRLAEHLDVSIEPLSKGQHGFALIGACEPAGVRLEAPAFERKQTVADALMFAARRYFEQYQKNLPALVAGKEDGVHQMRVAIRRLRSVLSAMRDYVPAHDYNLVNAQLKTIQKSLSETRDLDVLLARVHAVPTLPLRRTGAHRALVDTLSIRRQKALRDARRTLNSKAQTLIWLRAMHWFESLGDRRTGSPVHRTLGDEAPKILGELLKRVRKRGENFADLSPKDQHRVRIACKKLRYGIDLFASLYKKGEVADFVRKLKVVQDELGALNDAHMARHLLMHPTPAGKTAVPAGEAMGWLEHDMKPIAKKAARHLRRVMDTKPYW